MATLAHEVIDDDKIEPFLNETNETDPLLQVERSYRALVDAAPDAVLVIEEGRLRYRLINTAAEELLGYTRDDLLRMGPDDLLPVGQEATRADALRCVWETGSWRGEWRLRRQDGTDVLVEATITRREVGGRVLYEGLFRDISARKTAEEALRTSETRYRTIVESAHEGIWIIDAEGQTTFVNRRLADMFGYAPEEMLGRSMLSFMDQDAATIAEAHMARRRAGVSEQVDNRFQHRDGTALWAILSTTPLTAVDGTNVGALAMVTDITERKRSEAALQESERRLRSLVASLDEIVIEFDRVGTYLNVWTNDEGLLVAPRETLVGRNVIDVLGEDVGRSYIALFQKVLQDGQPEFVEYSLSVAGEPRDFLARISPVRWPDGIYQTVAMLARDVTERNSLQEQLRQAQKMEAIGTLAGGVAHDFNNLLTIITGYAELLLERPSDTKTHGQLQEILQAGDRAAALVHQLLAFSRQQVLAPQLLDLNVVVADTGRMLGRLIGENIDLRIVLSPRLGLVRVDPSQISQVILNLAVNARDAMPEGGKLTIETAAVDLDPRTDPDYADAEPGPYVMLSVTDTGHGMDATTLAHSFEPFFTTKGPGKGTGLGLATIYGIVTQSGGYIRVSSTPGQGATFRITFPSVGHAALTDGAATTTSAAPRGSETILLVEDETGVRWLARSVLEASGYTVLEADSGDQALMVVQQHTGPIALVLTDVVMPGMSGRELVQRLAIARPEVRVLYMSGHTDDAIVHHGVLTAGIAFIGKPFPPLALARRVREVLDASPS